MAAQRCSHWTNHVTPYMIGYNQAYKLLIIYLLHRRGGTNLPVALEVIRDRLPSLCLCHPVHTSWSTCNLKTTLQKDTDMSSAFHLWRSTPKIISLNYNDCISSDIWGLVSDFQGFLKLSSLSQHAQENHKLSTTAHSKTMHWQQVLDHNNTPG